MKYKLPKLNYFYDGLEPFIDAKTVLKNNGGGHLNHSSYWEIMGKEKNVDENLVKRIKDTFGSVEEFKELFSSGRNMLRIGGMC